MHVGRTGRRLVAGVLGLVLAAPLSLVVGGPPAVQAAPSTPEEPLTLVTLNGPGTAGGGSTAASLRARQDAVLAAIGAGEPTYRWTTALNGFAAELTPTQVTQLEGQPGVALVEPDTVRPLAGRHVSSTVLSSAPTSALRGGAGVVVGVVDSGIAPESPAFAALPGLGRDPRRFRGTCSEGDDWNAATCTRKVVGARWFVDGFGRDRVRTSESLSPRDALGHGTQVASVAAGNARVTVRVDGKDAGAFGGAAPQARIAAYKACWGAPDPGDDGCSTADVVSAVDAAVDDRVDVLTLAVAGGDGIDTLQRALLGAAEADIVVLGAAGNSSRDAWAAHAAPWVTTVGSALGRMPRGTVTLPGGRALVGGGRPTAVRARTVLAQDAAAPGASRRSAGQCRRNALDTRQVSGRIVVCRRGGVGRIDKSATVARAGGVGMVLVNVRRAPVSADFHSVPTVHLGDAEGRRLSRWVSRHPDARVRLARSEGVVPERRAAPWSAAGDPRGPVLKPDLVADGDAVLGALPESSGRGWGVFSGTSAATAQAAGVAALVRSRHPRWSAPVVRSLLVTSARTLPGSSVLLQGAGAVTDPPAAAHLALDVRPRAWRRALRTSRLAEVNAATLLVSTRQDRVVRRVTNVGRRSEYFSVSARGFEDHQVSVRPQAVRLAPGQSARFTITISGPATPGRLDDGEVVWLGGRGGLTRMPVAITR